MNYLISIGTLKLSYLTQSTKQSIQSYINSNRYVITHTDKVSVKGYKGAGYIAIDPTTGEGAYMISGGMNGSFLSPEDGLAIALIAMGILSLSLTGIAAVLIMATSIVYSIILTWYTYTLLEGCVPLQKLSVSLAILAFLAGSVGKTFAWIITVSGLGYLFGGNIVTASNICKE